MQPSKWLEKQVSFTYAQLARLFYISFVIAFFMLVAAIWALSIFSIISTVLASVLSAICTLFGLLLTLLQFAPRSPASMQAPVELLNPTSSLSDEDDAYRTFIDSERKRLYDSPNPHGTGTLIVRGNKQLAGDAVLVGSKSAYISERTEMGQLLYVGIIKNIPAGNHSATTPHRLPRTFTIHERDITEIDLRDEH